MQVLKGILEKLPSTLGPLLDVTSGPESSLQNFNFLGNSLLAEVDSMVADSMPGTPTNLLGLANMTSSLLWLRSNYPKGVV